MATAQGFRFKVSWVESLKLLADNAGRELVTGSPSASPDHKKARLEEEDAEET